MENHDVIVIGGGISGLAFAFESAAAGRSTLVLERADRVGGCLATHRTPAGFWFELGAHTCYDSYAALASIIDACGLRGSLIPRGATRLRLFDGDALVPGANLAALLRVIHWGEVLKSLPRAVTAKKDGSTVRGYYSRLVGDRNYEKAVGALLSAVPSQKVDDFPASMIFKSRPTKRRDFPASFTLTNGLRTIPESIAARPGIEVALGQAAVGIEMDGERYAVATGDGKRHVAPLLALATNPSTASSLLRGVAPGLAARIGQVGEAVVETLGFAVRADRVSLPESSFIVPCDDMFHSMVTRDAVPDTAWRGFAFHFRPGFSREEKLRRATALLHLASGDLVDVVEQRSVLPSPALGHADLTAEIDRLCAGRQLCVSGNWFAGLSIEDCVQRSREEWRRVAASR
jgi:oxygen-dependent protoporphyrinogen oxidase